MADAEEEEEGQVEASLEELIAKKADRPTITDDEDEDESLLAAGRDEARESLTTKVLPVQHNEFVCKSCFLVKHRSQLADRRRTLCRDCAEAWRRRAARVDRGGPFGCWPPRSAGRCWPPPSRP